MHTKKRNHIYAENKHLRENSCLVKGQPPTVAWALAPFPAHLPSPSHPFDSKVSVFSHTHCSHSLHAAPRGFLAGPDHLVIPSRGKKKMEWVDKCTAVWFIKLPRQWIYGSLEVFVFLEWSVAIIVTHMWTPTTPTRTPALLNIDKQSQKGKKNNKHKSSWLHSGCFWGEISHGERGHCNFAGKQTMFGAIAFNKCPTHIFEC